MRRLFVFACIAALFGAAPGFAQKPILPKQFQGWTMRGCTFERVRTVATKKPAGERRFESCSYSAGDRTIGITLGMYRDPSYAYQIYTGHLRTGMVPTNLGQTSAFDKDGVVIQEGVFVLDSTANISKDDLNAVVQAIEPQSEKGPLPPVRTYLPANGRVIGTERYALEPDALTTAFAELGQSNTAGLVNSAGFSSGAEAMVARYSTREKESGVLLLLEYPTPQLAEQHIHHLDEVLPPSAKQSSPAIERKGSLLALVLSASSPEYAKALREDTDYETHVTWNEPSQTATDPPWASVLAKIFIGTGFFMIAAIVLGIAFGGVRVITKRLFPGKVFDRPGNIEVLQLGLSSKPIDPKDMY